jgi:propanediol utilization protein
VKHKVSELEGELLDAAVAKADETVASGVVDELRRVAALTGTPRAKLVSDFNELHAHMRQGADVAAMRAYVASKFGEEVDLP